MIICEVDSTLLYLVRPASYVVCIYAELHCILLPAPLQEHLWHVSR